MVFFTILSYPQRGALKEEIPILSTSQKGFIQAGQKNVLIIGLTGAIGAGKSRVAAYFRWLGIPVHCADTYIHHLFATDTDVQEQVHSLWPDVFVEGKIDRLLLGSQVFSSPYDLRELEKLLFPKLVKNQKEFLKKNQYLGKDMVVLDIPLLFEVGLDTYCDYVILVSAPPLLRKQRVMQRKGMTAEKFQILEHLQEKEHQRRKKADFIIYAGLDKGSALKKIKKILFILSKQPLTKWRGNWPKTLERRLHE